MEGSKLLTQRSLRTPKLRGIKGGEWLKLFKDSALAWSEDSASSMGAAIAYYTIFSIAPLLIITMAIAGFFFGAEAAQGQIYGQAQSLLGSEGATALQGMVQSASKPAEGIFATLVSVLLMLMGASGVFAELQGAMDRIWRAPAEEKQSGIWYLLRRRIFTFGLLLAIAFLLLVSLTVSAFISTIQSLWSPGNASLEVVWQAINFVVSFLIITGLFAVIYKLLPRVSVAWRDVLVGSVITALLFTIGKFLIGLYIGKAGVTSGFGAAGAVIAMVLWVYYSAQIFLLGAEFTWLFAQRFGSLKGSGVAKLKNAEGIAQMPNDTIEPNRWRSKTTLNELFKKLLQDGKGWLEAELKLAKAEASHRLRNYAIAAGLGFVGFLILVGTLVVLAQACVALITPFVGGPAIAGLAVALVLLIVVVILALVAKHLLVRQLPPMSSVIGRLRKTANKTAHRT
ncbi:MAG TPA: YihY/virulence factor BrkB family protein [Aestuariivirga sp.]|nr:YihY/virulence factor BrkB family protein [Aestuariivirga sp.]